MSIFENYEQGELFRTSTMLTNAYSVLQDLIEGKEINKHGRECLTWAGNLVGSVNLDSTTYNNPIELDLVLLATSARPYFCDTLIKKGIYNYQEFLDKAYNLLMNRNMQEIPRQEATQIAEVIEDVSKSMLVYVMSCSLRDEDY